MSAVENRQKNEFLMKAKTSILKKKNLRTSVLSLWDRLFLVKAKTSILKKKYLRTSVLSLSKTRIFV